MYVFFILRTDVIIYCAIHAPTRKVSKVTRPSLPFRFIRERGMGTRLNKSGILRREKSNVLVKLDQAYIRYKNERCYIYPYP